MGSQSVCAFEIKVCAFPSICLCFCLCVRVHASVTVPSFHAPAAPQESSSFGSLSGLFNERASPPECWAKANRYASAAVSADVVTLFVLVNVPLSSEISVFGCWVQPHPAWFGLAVRLPDRWTPVEGLTPLLNPHLDLSALFFLAGSSVRGAEFGHLPDNITVLEGESVTLR